MLSICIPNKGRLFEEAFRLVTCAGIKISATPDRSLVAAANGGQYQIIYTRAQDIPRFVQNNACDLGITGLDLVAEQQAKVENVMDLDFGECRLVLAAHESSGYKNPEDIPNHARVATAFPYLTEQYFRKTTKRIQLIELSGAVEITPSIGIADVIVDLMQTGMTLKQNHLTLLDIILNSHAVVIASSQAVKKKKDEIDELASAFESVMNASHVRYLMANIGEKHLDEISKIVPGISSPSLMPLAKKGMYAIHAVVKDAEINGIIHKLKRAGATGILILPIERMIR